MTKRKTFATIAKAWGEIEHVLDYSDHHSYGRLYLVENILEERSHRGFGPNYSSHHDPFVTVARAAKLFAVKQIADYLTGEKMPELKDYLHFRKSCYTAAALVLEYGDKLRDALKDFDLAELKALDYSELVKRDPALARD